MVIRQLIRGIRSLVRQIRLFLAGITKRFVAQLLRGLLALGRRPQFTRAGFALPTTVMLVLVVTLTLSALSFRSFEQTKQVIYERQQQEIYNAATPAIERAKAKLNRIFDRNQEPRLPSGIPDETVLRSIINKAEGSSSLPIPSGGGTTTMMSP